MNDPTHAPLELLAAAKDITGSGKAALELVLQPQPAFHGQSLVDLARHGRLQDALDYLQSISSGSLG